MLDIKNNNNSSEFFHNCECELEKTHPAECVDDRRLAKLNYDILPEYVTRPERSHGPKMLGGAYSIMDIAVELAPDDMEPEFNAVLDLTLKAFKDAGYVPGIHMDNHHDEMNEEQLQELFEKVMAGEDVELSGCGYDGLVHSPDNPLGLSARSVAFHQKYPNRAVRFINTGVKLSILGGHHASIEKAYAIINTHSGTTIDPDKAIDLGQQVYDHDKEPFEKILDALADNADKIDKRWGWGDKIRNDGLKTYMKWYAIVGNTLAGMDPVEI